MLKNESDLRAVLLGSAVALMLGAGACSDAVTAPGGELMLSRDITMDELSQQLDAPVRVEISLEADGLVAREVEVERPGAREEEESVRAGIDDFAVDGGAGTLFLNIDGLSVGFDGETGFRGVHEGDMGFDGFVAHLEEARVAGIRVWIKAERAPRDTPQGPDAARFDALRIRLIDDAIRKIELDVNGANLRVNDAPPPDAILTVLGVPVELHVRDGRTQLRGPDDRREVAFEGRVHEADPVEGVLVVGDGHLVQVLDDTRMAIGDREIESLEPIAEALEAGLMVFARGEGVVREGDRDVILAHVVRFAIDGERDEVAFEGAVEAVHPEEGALVLSSDQIILIGDDTRMAIGDREIESLEPIVEALRAGHDVHARGEGVIVSADRHIIAAHVIVFAIEGNDDDGGAEQFAGPVASVNLDAGSFTLVEGPEIFLADDTDIHPEGDLLTLEAVAEAVAADLPVVAEGAVVEREGHLVARHVKFEVND